MIWKNSSSSALSWRFIIRYVLDIIAAFRSLIKGEWDTFKAITRAHFDFWRSFPETHEKRVALQDRRKIEDDPDTILPVNIIWEYFGKGKRTFREIF